MRVCVCMFQQRCRWCCDFFWAECSPIQCCGSQWICIHFHSAGRMDTNRLCRYDIPHSERLAGCGLEAANYFAIFLCFHQSVIFVNDKCGKRHRAPLQQAHCKYRSTHILANWLRNCFPQHLHFDRRIICESSLVERQRRVPMPINSRAPWNPFDENIASGRTRPTRVQTPNTRLGSALWMLFGEYPFMPAPVPDTGWQCVVFHWLQGVFCQCIFSVADIPDENEHVG